MKPILAVSTTLAALAAAGLYHHRRIQATIHLVPRDRIKSTPTIPDAFKHGLALAIVNPNNHTPVHDVRRMEVRVPDSTTDEEMLAAFVCGFFGGRVFSLERSILTSVRRERSHFNALGTTRVSSYIWSPAQLSTKKLPPLHTLLFGVFRVVDLQLLDGASYIDFGFGSDNGAVAGVHRFSVSSCSGGRDKHADGTRAVTIEIAHSGCNPRDNKPLGPEVLQALHLWYAMLLFREGVAGVIRAY